MADKNSRLALAEVRLVIASIIRRYDLRCTMQDSWTEQPTYLLWNRKPLWVELIPVGEEWFQKRQLL